MSKYKPNIMDAILSIHPTAKFNMINGDDWEHVEWKDGHIDEPSQSDVETKLASMISDWEAQEYARARQPLYPDIGDQLDMQYHDELNGTTTWKDAVAKVKADNPKPE